MVYGLGQVNAGLKQVFSNQSMQLSSTDVASKYLTSSKEKTKMDLLVLESKSLKGFTAKNLLSAIESRVPGIGILVFYNKQAPTEISANERELIFVRSVAKFTEKEMKPHLEEVLQKVKDEPSQSHVEVSSEKIGKVEVNNEDDDEEEVVINNIFNIKPEEETKELEFNFSQPESQPQPQYEPEPEPEEETIIFTQKTKTNFPEQQNMSIDLKVIKEAISKQVMSQQLLQENLEYASAMSQLSIIEEEIYNIYKNPKLSSHNKLDEIKKLGFKKSAYKDVANSMLTEKFLEILRTTVDHVESTFKEEVIDIKRNLDDIKTTKGAITNASYVNDNLDQRLALRVQAQHLLDTIISIYQVLQENGNNIIKSLDEGLPTQNSFINELYALEPKIFMPSNAVPTAIQIWHDLKKDADRFGILEDDLSKLIQTIFEFTKLDKKTIDDQERYITLLKTQNLESIIIPENLVQTRTRAFIGPNDIGRTATFVTMCEAQSRRYNTLVLSLSKNIKLRDYGISPLSMEAITIDKIKHQLVYLEEHVDSIERMRQIIKSLEDQAVYYSYINLIFDDTQMDFIHEISKNLISVTFMTNTTTRSMNTIRDLYKDYKPENTARRLVIIDPIDNLPHILSDMGIDVTLTKLITIPHMPGMRKCALMKRNPAKDSDLYSIVDYAFKD